MNAQRVAAARLGPQPTAYNVGAVTGIAQVTIQQVRCALTVLWVFLVV